MDGEFRGGGYATAINDFSLAIENAADGGKTLTLIKNRN